MSSSTSSLGQKQIRSIKYQLTIAKLPFAKDLDDVEFGGDADLATCASAVAGAPHNHAGGGSAVGEAVQAGRIRYGERFLRKGFSINS